MNEPNAPIRRATSLRDYGASKLERPANLSDRLEHAALAGVSGLLGALPLDAASAAMGRIWRTVAPYNRRHARADANLAAAMPHLTVEERRTILLAMWENLGRVAAETLRLQEVIADPERVTVDLSAIEAVRPELAGGSIFASLHQGNYELAGWGMRLAGLPTAAVYRPLTNPLSEAMLRRIREPIYDAGLHFKQRATPMVLRSLVRKGAAVGMLADLRDTSGIRAPFLGRPCWMATFPAVLARRMKVPLVAGRVLRTGGVRFRIEARPIEVPVTGDAESDIREATLSLNRQFEAWVLDAPGQWMWGNKKWD